MSEEQKAGEREIRRIVRLLERMRALAQESTMTGALRNGQAYAVQQYNAIVAALAEEGVILPRYFPAVAEDATWGSVGFASAQLAEYLKEMVEGPGEASREEAAGGAAGSFFDRFFGSGEFQHIGEAMRGAFPDWMREARRRWEGPQAAGATTPLPGAARPAEGSPPGEQESRLADLSARMEEIAAQMRRPDVPLEELRRLAAELARLGEEQARIARESGAPGASRTDVDVDVDVDV